MYVVRQSIKSVNVILFPLFKKLNGYVLIYISNWHAAEYLALLPLKPKHLLG